MSHSTFVRTESDKATDQAFRRYQRLEREAAAAIAKSTRRPGDKALLDRAVRAMELENEAWDRYSALSSKR